MKTKFIFFIIISVLFLFPLENGQAYDSSSSTTAEGSTGTSTSIYQRNETNVNLKAETTVEPLTETKSIETTEQEESCSGSVALGCPAPTISKCKDGKWICVLTADEDSAASGGKVFPETNNLQEMEPRLTSAIQIKAVEVRGWDPEKKKELLETVKAQAEAKSGQELENFAKGVLLRDENVESVSISEEKTELTYRMPAKFLGIFKTTLRARIETDSESRVKVKYPWYSFFHRKHVSASSIQGGIEKELQGIKQAMQTQAEAQKDDKKNDNFALQNSISQYQRTLEIMSNISKSLHDTASSIIGNIR